MSATDLALPASPPAHQRFVGLPEVDRGAILKRGVVVLSIFLWYFFLWGIDLFQLRWLPYWLTLRTKQYRQLELPAAMRMAFEALGPTYIKLGQLVASGEALFPDGFSEEFQKCLDRVPPFPYSEVQAAIREELGEAPEEAFASIEAEPIAAASIAQVHLATLESGEEVVVKVQRPGIGQLAAADVAWMRQIARFLQAVSEEARNSNFLGVVEDFEANLREELDFRNETQRMAEFNAVMAQMGTDSVAAPVVHHALSGKRVLTMERFVGWSLADTEAILASGYDAEERLLTGIRAWFQCLILGGFFHGDVHAGNFMLLRDGRIGYLDFGIVGVFNESQKKNVLDYVLAFQSRDFHKLADTMVAMDTVDAERIDRDRFAGELAQTFSAMVDPKVEFKMRDIVPSLLRVSRKNRMRMPRDLVLVTKQLVYLDRYTRAIGGPKMNVLTDRRLQGMIMQDMMAVTFGKLMA